MVKKEILAAYGIDVGSVLMAEKILPAIFNVAYSREKSEPLAC